MSLNFAHSGFTDRLKNAGATAEAGGFSRPTEAIILRLQPRFDSMVL